MILRAILALVVAFSAQPSLAAQSSPSDQIIDVRDSDPEINAAKLKGRATLSDFYEHLRNPGPNETEFMVKFDIDPSDEVEYVWADHLQKTERSLVGVLLNQPVNTQDRRGDRVLIPEALIIDWGYRQGGIMQGSFTNRVLLNRMPADVAAQYRAFLGW